MFLDNFNTIFMSSPVQSALVIFDECSSWKIQRFFFSLNTVLYGGCTWDSNMICMWVNWSVYKCLSFCCICRQHHFLHCIQLLSESQVVWTVNIIIEILYRLILFLFINDIVFFSFTRKWIKIINLLSKNLSNWGHRIWNQRHAQDDCDVGNLYFI